MDILSRVASAIQDVFTESADMIARQTGLVKRQRKLTGSMFAQTFTGSHYGSSIMTLNVSFTLTFRGYVVQY